MAMYISEVEFQGKTLLEWRGLLKGQYSIGELYRMVHEGRDLAELQPDSCQMAELSGMMAT